MRSDIQLKINKLLESASLKKTLPRRKILEEMLNSSKPRTADEIITLLGKNCPNRVTVYRILENLAEYGLVHRAYIERRSQYYELADKCSEHQCHPHFTCTDCGKTSCLPEVSLPMAANPPAGFVIEHQQVQLAGLCPKCSHSKS